MVGLALVIHVLWILVFPVQVRWGDEENYAAFAHRFMKLPERLLHLVPGTMPLYWQPPFPYSVYGLLIEREFAEEFHRTPMPESVKRWSPGFAGFYRRIAFLNLGLLVITGGCIYEFSRRCRFGRTAGLLATAGVVFNPRLAFFVQALWPELLHLALFGGALLSLVALLQSDRKPTLFRLALPGCLFGFCALTKGIAPLFLLFALPILAREIRRPTQNGRISFRHVLILYAVFAVMVIPQMFANRVTRGIPSIATNTWINIERGVVPEDEAGVNQYRRYFGCSNDPVERERLSRKRVIAYLTKGNPLAILFRQTGQFVDTQLSKSYFVRGLRESRWRGLEPGRSLTNIAGNLVLVGSWATLLLGFAGLIRERGNSPASLLLTLFLFLYLVVVLVIGFNPRFFMQGLPFLGIFASSFLVWSLNRVSSKNLFL